MLVGLLMIVGGTPVLRLLIFVIVFMLCNERLPTKLDIDSQHPTPNNTDI